MRALCGWITVGLFALAPSVAVADLISEEEAQCRSQKEGAVCKTGGDAGTCQKSTCSRNDYSEGVPPKQEQVECMVCKPGAPAAEPVAQEKEAPESKGDEEPAKDAKPESKEDASSKSGGCAVGQPGPFALGLLLLGGVVWARRRA